MAHLDCLATGALVGESEEVNPPVTTSPSAWQRLTETLNRPTTQADLLQILKSVLAAMIAWLLAVNVFELAQPFLAPWTALMTVHATIHRSLSRGMQIVVATLLGVGLAYVFPFFFGMGVGTLGMVLLIGLLLSRIGYIRAEGIVVATTALFVLTTNWRVEETMVLDRVLDTLAGVVIGVLVNVLVVPPLNTQMAGQYIEGIDRGLGRLLMDLAEDARRPWTDEDSSVWVDRTRKLDDDLDNAWELVREAQESVRWNPRRRWSREAIGDPAEYELTLVRLEEGIAQTRSMVRLIHESTVDAVEWDDFFAERWCDLLEEVGRRIYEPDGDLAALTDEVRAFAKELAERRMSDVLWPIYGTLVSALLNIIRIVGNEASSRAARA